ncbi:MAG: TolC family protein [Chitinophagales bacterium]|nr:TolC family protein [Chitinophagales bacterium]
MKICKIICVFFMIMPVILSAQTLTLQQALNTAWENNYGIKIINKELQITDLQNHAGYAGMLPVISAIANYDVEVTNSEQQYFSGETRSEKNAGANSLDAGVYLDWTVFDGLGMFARKDKLEQLYALGELEVRAKLEEITMQLMIDWNNLIQLENAKRVMENAIDISGERLKIAQQRNVIGSGSGLDVLQAQVDLNTDSSAYINILLQIKNTKAVINEYMARDANTTFDINEKIAVDQTINLTSIKENVYANNTSLLIAEKNKQIAELQVKEYKSYLYPTVSLNAGYGFLKSVSEAGFVESNLNVGPLAGVSLVIPLFNGFTVSRNIEQMKVMQQMQELDILQTQLSVNTNLVILYNQYETSLQLMKIEQKNIESATKNVSIALEKFNLGAITSVELREIQLQKVNTENRYLTEELNAKIAELQLKYFSGKLITQ